LAILTQSGRFGLAYTFSALVNWYEEVMTQLLINFKNVSWFTLWFEPVALLAAFLCWLLAYINGQIGFTG